MIIALCIAGYLIIGYILGLFFTWFEIREIKQRKPYDENDVLTYKRTHAHGLIVTMMMIWPVMGFIYFMVIVTDWFVNNF